jgi:phosphatidyl-myo-inositol dimannoside synthase
LRSLRILMLLTDGFGGFGGIATFNQNFVNALNASSLVEHVYVLPRLVLEPIGADAIPQSVVYDRNASKGKLPFLIRLCNVGWRSNQIDLVICGHINLLPAAWLLARARGARLALILHGVEAWRSTSSAVVNRLTSLVDAIISVSRYSAGRYLSWSHSLAETIFILPNCIDLKRFVPTPRDPSLVARYGLGSRKVIMTLGRLAPEERYKGFDEVMQVMPALLKTFPELTYLIIGDGQDKPRLEAKARTLGIFNRVTFAGRIPEADKVAHYSLADVYAMPSYGEGFGIVLLEAAACGVPVIGSKADGAQEALLDGVLGKIVDPKNEDELIAAITDALASPQVRVPSPQIHKFSEARFRQRVDSWLETQRAAIGAYHFSNRADAVDQN